MVVSANQLFDAAFVPTDEMRNILVGLAVGAFESPGRFPWSVDDLWIEFALPADIGTIRRMLEHGWLQAREYADGSTPIGLTDGALVWLNETFGMPHAQDAIEIGEWIIETLEPQFRRRGRVTAGQRELIRSILDVVGTLSYNPGEADEIGQMFDRLAARGSMSQTAAVAYKRHVARRTTRNFH